MAPPTSASWSFSLARDAFLLDVDGTILDIAPTPETVSVPGSLVETLTLLQRLSGGAVALVSGREIAVLDRLFAPLSLPAIGCHGAEWRGGPDGAIEVRSPPLSAKVRETCRAAVAGETRLRIEDKGYSVAFHYRAAPELGPALEMRLVSCLKTFSSELRLLHGKLVIEVTPRGFDKGEAICMLMDAAPFAGRRPIFLGDDTTDQSALIAATAMGGVGISVGRPFADAKLMLPDPPAAREWLASLVATGRRESET